MDKSAFVLPPLLQACFDQLQKELDRRKLTSKAGIPETSDVVQVWLTGTQKFAHLEYGLIECGNGEEGSNQAMSLLFSVYLRIQGHVWLTVDFKSRPLNPEGKASLHLNEDDGWDIAFDHGDLIPELDIWLQTLGPEVKAWLKQRKPLAFKYAAAAAKGESPDPERYLLEMIHDQANNEPDPDQYNPHHPMMWTIINKMLDLIK